MTRAVKTCGSRETCPLKWCELGLPQPIRRLKEPLWSDWSPEAFLDHRSEPLHNTTSTIRGERLQLP